MADIMTSQPLWLRRCELVVGDANQNTIDLSPLQIKFDVYSQNVQTMRRLEVRIYNPSEHTSQMIEKEFTYVQLSAGYQDSPYGVIFAGRICQISRGKENATDTYLDLVAMDGDEPYNWATIGISIPASQTKPADQHAALIKAMSKYGVKAGNVPALPAKELPRGKVIYGMVRDKLRTLADSVNCEWHLEDNIVDFVPSLGYIPGPNIVLSPATGLIGVPVQTIDGLNLTCLLNPNVKTGRLIKVDTSDIATTAFTNPLQPGVSDLPYIPDTSATSQYKVYAVHHTGDTRGNQWYTEIIAEALNPTNGNVVNSPARVGAIVNGE